MSERYPTEHFSELVMLMIFTLILLKWKVFFNIRSFSPETEKTIKAHFSAELLEMLVFGFLRIVSTLKAKVLRVEKYVVA